MKKVKAERAKAIVEALKTATSRKDALTQFVVNGYKDELAEIQAENFEILLDAAKIVGLTYMFLGERELCGCERILNPAPWPAIWLIPEMIGVYRCGGNSDQTQVSDAYIYFGRERVGAWHIIERRRLTSEEEESKKFYKVVTGWRGCEAPVY